jgi:hypothetical protein
LARIGVLENIMNSALNDLFSGSKGITAADMKREADAQMQKGRGDVFAYTLKSGQKGLIYFLNDAIDTKPMVHSVKMLSSSGKRYDKPVLCLGDGCPLCAAGVKKSRKAYWLIVDLLHEYEVTLDSGEKKTIRQPTVKLLARGKREVELYERFASNNGGSLTGKVWEVERMGESYDTTYMLFGPTEQRTLDLNQKRKIRNQKNEEIDVHVIRQPSWPSYQTTADSPEDGFSVYTRNKLRPEGEPNFNDPKQVELWLQLFLANTPLTFYRTQAKKIQEGGNASESPAPEFQQPQQPQKSSQDYLSQLSSLGDQQSAPPASEPAPAAAPAPAQTAESSLPPFLQGGGDASSWDDDDIPF